MGSHMHFPKDLQKMLEKIGFTNVTYDPTNHSLTYAIIGTK